MDLDNLKINSAYLISNLSKNNTNAVLEKRIESYCLTEQSIIK